MSDTTAKIRAKGLDATGVTETIASQMYTRKGSHYMAIVEIKVDETHENAEGKRKVDLVITQVEPSTDPTLDDHLRELTRTLYYNRQTADGNQPTLETGDTLEPTVEAVINANPGLKPHPYLTSQLAIDDTEAGPVCDVCGKAEADVIHHMPAVDPFTVDEPEDEQVDEDLEEDDDRFAGEHEYEPGPDDSCLCGAAVNAEAHWWPVDEPDGAA
jgi:hypothetical protein